MNYYNRTKQSKKILKDLNFLELNRTSKRNILRLNSNVSNNLNQIIASDTMFLKSKGIMDYSFLLKSELHRNDTYYEVNRHCIISSDKREVYHIGIIDYL